MDKIEFEPDLDEMTRENGDPPVSGHDEWVRLQIEKRLAKKAAGKAVYHDFSEVAAEFGLNARSDS